MKRSTLFVVVLLSCCLVMAQEPSASQPAVTLMSGIGDLHHPVSTKNPAAQQFFDQGLRLIYAFNHDEAARSFQHAAELDPHMAMAYWGIAESVGPNYNDPADDDRRKQAYEAVQKALQLSANSTAIEKAYIEAMAQRYPSAANADWQQAAINATNAMREVRRNIPMTWTPPRCLPRPK